jgi:hypothetical protein
MAHRYDGLRTEAAIAGQTTHPYSPLVFSE